MRHGSPTISSGVYARVTGAGRTSTQQRYHYYIPFPASPLTTTKTSSSSSSSSSSTSTLSDLSSALSNSSKSSNSSYSSSSPSFSPKRYLKPWRRSHKQEQTKKQTQTSVDSNSSSEGPTNIDYTIISCPSGRSHAIQFFETSRLPPKSSKHESIFYHSWRNNRLVNRLQSLQTRDGVKTEKTERKEKKNEKKVGFMLGFCYYQVPEGVEWEVLEKRVFWVQDENVERGGGWVLELVNEVERGRSRRERVATGALEGETRLGWGVGE